MRTSSRRLVVTAVSVAASLALTLAPAAAAADVAADVIVSPSTATQGDYTTLTFVVPNESESASTVKVKVAFPTKPPLASVRVKRQPGWTADVIETKVRGPGDTCDCAMTPAVTSITWTADKSARISPGEFDEFEVFVGPLPLVERLTFPTVQTYDDGSVERSAARASAEGQSAHPAPALTLRAAPAAAGEASTAGDSESGVISGLTRAGWTGASRWIGVAAVVLGVGVMAAAGGLALVRRRGSSLTE
ncbi:YcnI family protein [Actinopolymorpha sp. B11F2]|uniref:YcnI family protein n=1 Tax=Actinopolymorpha sp. B11F2 TaxID=3160862 RepID=UPI0032E47244